MFTSTENISFLMANLKLTLNYEESSFMFLTKSMYHSIPLKELLNFKNEFIKYSPTMKFLGPHLDENVSRFKYIQILRRKFSELI